MNFLQVVLDKQMLKWIFFVSALLFASSINAQESFRQIQKPVICGTQPDIFEKIQEAGEDDIQRRNTIAILLQEWN
jgi:anti-anti-sigma regulatory factor